MGKTTNALEAVVRARTDGRDAAKMVDALRQDHLAVLAGVAPGHSDARAELMAQFDRLAETLRHGASTDSDRDYDAIVSFGELWSTLIVTAHLNAVGLKTCWVDARTMVSTDALYRSARIDWAASATHAPAVWAGVSGSPRRLLTQGFVGRAPDGTTTTLGREGSDFSAAILAYLLDAESVTIWKDVPGMFNADPKRFPDTKLLSHISYREAIELSYFGASVIHPRTLQPLQKKHIPLYVRSFTDASAPGTTIDDHNADDSLIPSFIVKGAQLLISITPRDLSFIVEENLSDIFRLFATTPRTHRADAEQRRRVQRGRGRYAARARTHRGADAGVRGVLQRRVRARDAAALRRADRAEADRRQGDPDRAAQPEYRAVRPEMKRSSAAGTPASCGLSQYVRRASEGSMRAARRAGPSIASRLSAPIPAAAAMSTAGSNGCTS